MLRITALMENKASANRALVNEHGLSLLLEADGRRILFDCGQGAHFIDNAHRLGISLHGLDAAVISHGHYDHAAGFRDFLESGYTVPCLYVGKGFFDKKYSRNGIRHADLSSGWNEAFVLSYGVAVREIDSDTEIFPGMTIFRGFPCIYSEETIPERFVKETAEGIINDDFSDEIAMGIDTDNGLALITGCSHPGMMNILDTVRKRTGKNIYAVIGGTHLSEANDARIVDTLSHLRTAGVEIAALCHCSGARAEELAADVFGEKAAGLSAGESIFL